MLLLCSNTQFKRCFAQSVDKRHCSVLDCGNLIISRSRSISLQQTSSSSWLKHGSNYFSLVRSLSLSRSCRSIDDGASQHIPLCRRLWHLSLRAEVHTWPHTVPTDPYRRDVCGGLRYWGLRTRFAPATRHSPRSLANPSSQA